MGRDRRADLSDDDDMPTLDLQAASPSLDDLDMDADGLPPTNRNADHHTIVDMNLRTVRFVIVVAVALTVAFTYAFLTIDASVVEHVAKKEDVASRVAFYNVLFGGTMFAAGKVFEIYSETLIFPTLHTYLHNCSLYPGDEPARTSSKVKSNAIFWGLKTVVILMNVGTASLFVSQRTRETVATVALAVENHVRHLQAEPVLTAAVLDDADRQRRLLETCGSQWTRSDVDYTSVTLGVARRPWSNHIKQQVEASTAADAVVVRLEDCANGVEDACESALKTHGIDADDVVALLAAGVPTHVPKTTMREAAAEVLAYLHSRVADASDRDTTLAVQHLPSVGGMASLSATLRVARSVPTDAVRCGDRSCVVVADAEPAQEVFIQQLQHTKWFTSATTRSAAVAPDGSLHETLSLSFASHHLPSALSFAVDDSGSHIAAHNLSGLALRPTRLAQLNAIVLPEASGLTTWLPLDGVVTAQCDALVDSFVDQFQRDAAAFSHSRLASTIVESAVLFLMQDAAYVPSETAALARRLAESASKDATVQLTLSISVYSATATFTGCGVMVLLMIFVIVRPAARVRLSPNTTPAAQYVQILTDDLYPNIVHKKRLRFVNGEVLPFNEYVVDSIVLHAKRDESKKIYL